MSTGGKFLRKQVNICRELDILCLTLQFLRAISKLCAKSVLTLLAVYQSVSHNYVMVVCNRKKYFAYASVASVILHNVLDQYWEIKCTVIG